MLIQFIWGLPVPEYSGGPGRPFRVLIFSYRLQSALSISTLSLWRVPLEALSLPIGSQVTFGESHQKKPINFIIFRVSKTTIALNPFGLRHPPPNNLVLN